MSRRFSLVLSEFKSAASVPRSVCNHGAVAPPGMLQGRAANHDPQQNSIVTRRVLPAYTTDLEACNPQHGAVMVSPTQHQHHVVALDVPVLPRRAGLRNCVVCMACLWLWIATAVFLSLFQWRPDFNLALQTSRRIPFMSNPTNSPRVSNENSHCTFSVVHNVGHPSKLQMVVTLASTIAPSVDEEDVVVTQLSLGAFEVDVACCTKDLYTTLKTEHWIASWNYQLQYHYGASVLMSRVVQFKKFTNVQNASFVTHGVS